MARMIPLKSVTVANGVGIDSGDPQVFNWGEMIRIILKTAPPQKGLSMDEVLQCVDALKPLDAAIAEHADHVTFSEAQYQMLRKKLSEFAFGLAVPEVAEFGLAIRDAPEIT